jgi:hypothetical protein
MIFMQLKNLVNPHSTSADRLIELSHKAHRINLKRGLASRLATAKAQNNSTLVELLESEAEYLES